MGQVIATAAAAYVAESALVALGLSHETAALLVLVVFCYVVLPALT